VLSVVDLHTKTLGFSRENNSLIVSEKNIPLISSRSSIAWLTVALLTIGAIATTARACFVCVVPYQSVLDKVESSNQAIVARAVDEHQSKWQVTQVIRGPSIDVAQRVAANSELVIGSDQSQLLWRAKPDAPWTIEGHVDPKLLRFLDAAVELSSKLSNQPNLRQQAQYYRHFLPYLEHPHPQISDSAYNKIAKAPYTVLRQIAGELDPVQLVAWIENPSIGPKRGSLYITLLGICGGSRELATINRWIDRERQTDEALGALLAAHAELSGEETIRLIETSYLQNRDRTLGELIAAVNALRVHGQADGKVARSRIVASFQLLMRERPALAEIIIEDCARWEEWSVAPQLMEMYASGKQPWNNALILKYLEACPLPEAKQFVMNADGE
jgi:hypothetical protein